jgi:hypothetical protein
METFSNLTPQQLRRAADVKEKIDALQDELSRLLGASTPATVVKAAAPKRKKISAAGIARIRAAQRARWAAIKQTKAPGRPAVKRKVSAAGRARLAALARARWAKVKAAGGHSL